MQKELQRAKEKDNKFWMVEVQELNTLDTPNYVLVLASDEQQAIDKAKGNGWTPIVAKEATVIL